VAFEDTGVDQVIFIQQGGKNRHEHICESLELFARDVMPEFKDREIARAKEKQQRLAPVIEAALARKRYMPPLADTEIPEIHALGRQIVEQGTEDAAVADTGSGLSVPLRDPVADPR
jgi:hypothetical protein